MPDFCSRSASLRSRSAAVTGERIFAWSTTLPVSGGKLAAASAAPTHSAAMRAPIRARGQRRGIRALLLRGLELHLRGRLGVGVGGERNQRLNRAEYCLRPKHTRKGSQRGVEVLHRGDVVAAGDGDPVFGALELGLQRQEVRVRFEVWIVFADREETAKGAGERVLRIL